MRFEHQLEPYGVFSYLSDAEKVLVGPVAQELEELRLWFCDHLDAPDLLTIERFWFCWEAEEHVRRARRMSEILNSAGIPIVERRTRRVPGKVKWQDRNQVAVRMYKDTPQPSRRSGE